jgi:hypothetical protein
VPKLNLIGRAAGWTARHPRAGPFAWGLTAAAAGLFTLIGSSVPGYIVGRAGVGRAGLVLSACAFVIGFEIVVALEISRAASSCPSCADALILAPVGSLLFLIPFVIGYWLGNRAKHQAIEDLAPSGAPRRRAAFARSSEHRRPRGDPPR